MKSIAKSVLVLTVAFAATAFTTPVKKNINTSKSSIEWTGKKVLGSHNGTINLKEGYVEMNNGQLTGGMFVVDMTSIVVTDLQGESKGNLEGHLKSDDFFGVASHPTATLVIKDAEPMIGGYSVTGDITIKGITESIQFDLSMGDNGADAKVVIDRTKFNVRYGSGSFFDNLGDKTIDDNFELSVSLKF